MLDFIFALPLCKEGYNILIFIIYKFFKRVVLIKAKDTFIAKKWANAFIAKLDLINLRLFDELITYQEPKFLSKF